MRKSNYSFVFFILSIYLCEMVKCNSVAVFYERIISANVAAPFLSACNDAGLGMRPSMTGLGGDDENHAATSPRGRPEGLS